MTNPRSKMRVCARHRLRFVELVACGKVVTGCPRCHADDDLAKAQEADDLAARAEGRLQRRLLADAGVDGWYAEATFSNFQCDVEAQASAVEDCRAFVDGFGQGARGLVLLGGPRVGKTHLLAATAAAMLSFCKGSVLLVTPADLPEPGAAESIQRLASVELLCIDDLGALALTPDQQLALDRVIDLRSRHRRAVAVATPLTADALPVALGNRIYTRVLDGALVVPLSWPAWPLRHPLDEQ